MSHGTVRSPRDLHQQAGLIPAALTLALAAASPAAAQSNKTPGSQPGSAPWQSKADPAMREAAIQPVVDQPAPRDPTRPAPPTAGGGGGNGGGDQPRVKVSEHQTVDLHVKDESIANVLELLSVQSQRNIIASKNVVGKVSADLFNVSFFEALDAILHVNGFAYIQKGNFIYVYTREEYLEIQKSLSKRVAKVMRLSYLNASDAEAFVKPLLSQGGDIKTAAKTPDFTIGGDAPVGKDDYALGAVLVVIDYEENIAAVEKLLTEIDTRPAQVLVEATILETRVTEANAFGIDFSIIGDVDFLDFVNLGGARRAADSLIRGGTGATGGLSPTDNRAGAVSTSAGNTQDGRATVKVGVVAGPIGVFLRALDDVSDFTVLSSPKLLALNRMPSRVLVGQRVGYLNTTATETSTTQTVQFLDTGTTLFFRPFVSNTGEIRMELKPKVASATIRDAGNGQGGIVSIPDETTQEVTTNVIVKDGNTIVLGGLFVERTDSFRRQVPFFGDIPLIGAAFRGHDDSTDRRELIFLIRPSIVNDTALAMQGIDMKNEIERIRAGQRQGLLPWSREKMTSVLNVEAETAARAGNTEEALWKIQRSLSLNPRQPDALRLRERITAQQERWPSMFTLDGIISGEINKALESIPPAPESRRLMPDGAAPIPMRPVPEKMRSEGGEGLMPMVPQATDAGTVPVGGEEVTEPMAEEPAEPTITAQAPELSSLEPMNSEPKDLSGFFNASGNEQAAIVIDPGQPSATAPVDTAFDGEPNEPLGHSLPSGQPVAASEPVNTMTGSSGQLRFVRFWGFVRAVFLGGDQPAVAGSPADAAHQPQEMSK
jgi:type IV pilus assembly protein PilQ